MQEGAIDAQDLIHLCIIVRLATLYFCMNQTADRTSCELLSFVMLIPCIFADASLTHTDLVAVVSTVAPTQISTLAALAYHKSTGHEAAHPNQRLSFAENFLYMLDSNGNVNYRCATRWF
jgi:hypothetical protein